MNENTNQTANQPAPKTFNIIDGNTLMAQEYPPLQFSVEKILPHGLFIIDTLKNMDVASFQDMYFLSTYNGSQVSNALNIIFDLGLDKKYYQPNALNKIIKNISS